MALKIRLARHGAKKRPYYRVVIADSRAPRDGRFIEIVGRYNPMLPKDSADRVQLDIDKCKEWLGKGARPTDRVARFLSAAGIWAVSYTHLRAHETRGNLVCRLLLVFQQELHHQLRPEPLPQARF